MQFIMAGGKKELVLKNRSIQGLRAYLAALVVASHCDYLNQGGWSVNFFFCISGFFVINPFSKNDLSFHSLNDVWNYYLKKIKAIIPAYWIAIIGIKCLTDDAWFTWTALFKAMSFIDCPGHFWYIQQMALMYLITPLIVLLLQGIFYFIKSEQRYLFGAGALAVISFLCYKYLTENVFYLCGNGAHRKFDIWAYLIGVVFGLVCKYLLKKGYSLNTVLASIISGSIIVFPIVTSSTVLRYFNPEWNTYYIGWEKRGLCIFLAGILLLTLALNQENRIVKILSLNPVVKLGNISYETYIVHWYFVSALSWSSRCFKNFLMVYVVTICASLVLKRIVDYICNRSFIVKSKKDSLKPALQN